MMVKKLLGDLVKEERLRRNLSQNALAENVHVSLRTISDIENYNAILILQIYLAPCRLLIHFCQPCREYMIASLHITVAMIYCYS